MEVDSGSACIVWHKKANNVCVLMGIETQYLSDYVEYVDLMNMIMSDVYGNPPEDLSKKRADFDKKYRVNLGRPGTVVEISDPFHQGKKEPPKSVKYVSLAALELYECSSEGDLPACKHYFGERAKLLGSIIGARVQYDSPVFDKTRTCYKVNFRIISEDQTLSHLKKVSEQTFGFLLKSSIKSSYRSTFGILKGRSYDDETAEQTMRREIKEESGTKLGSSVKLTDLHAKDHKNQFFALKIEEKDVDHWNANLKSRETRNSGELFDLTFVEFFDENMQEIHSPFGSKFKMNRVSSKILSVFVDACNKGEIDGCMSAARAARADSPRGSPRPRADSPRADSHRPPHSDSYRPPRSDSPRARADSRADSYRTQRRDSSYRTTQRRESSPRRDRLVSTIRKDDRGNSRPGDRGNSRPGDRGNSRPGDRGNSRPGDRGNSRPGDRGNSRPGDRGNSRPGTSRSSGYRGYGGRTRTRKRKY
jgi:ADP-ribose pyrophosphatase YjhB (NUDIX family)